MMSKYAPDLAKHRFYVWLNNWHWIPMVVLGLILLAIGGLPMMLWGICVRIVFGLHATWLVNSATHMWGGRRFNTRDDSRNNWWVALITFGEGWHNNHHAHPTSARHGLAWYEFDPSWITISMLEAAGYCEEGSRGQPQQRSFGGAGSGVGLAFSECAAGPSACSTVARPATLSVRPIKMIEMVVAGLRCKSIAFFIALGAGLDFRHTSSLRRLGTTELAHRHPALPGRFTAGADYRRAW